MCKTRFQNGFSIRWGVTGFITLLWVIVSTGFAFDNLVVQEHTTCWPILLGSSRLLVESFFSF